MNSAPLNRASSISEENTSRNNNNNNNTNNNNSNSKQRTSPSTSSSSPPSSSFLSSSSSASSLDSVSTSNEYRDFQIGVTTRAISSPFSSTSPSSSSSSSSSIPYAAPFLFDPQFRSIQLPDHHFPPSSSSSTSSSPHVLASSTLHSNENVQRSLGSHMSMPKTTQTLESRIWSGNAPAFHNNHHRAAAAVPKSLDISSSSTSSSSSTFDLFPESLSPTSDKLDPFTRPILLQSLSVPGSGYSHSHSSTPTLSQLLAAIPTLPIPRPLPSVYEAAASWKSQDEWRKIMIAIATVLSENKAVDFKLVSKENRYEGLYCSHNSAVSFHLQVFLRSEDVPSPDKGLGVVIELQRRFGDPFQFHSFFNLLEAQLADHIHIEPVLPSVNSSNTNNKSEIPESALALIRKYVLNKSAHHSDHVSTISCLFHMANSSKLESKRDAIQALGSIFSEDDVDDMDDNPESTPGVLARALTSYQSLKKEEDIGIIEVLDSGLSYNDNEIVRATATFVSNLSAQRSLHPLLKSSRILRRIMEILNESPKSSVVESTSNFVSIGRMESRRQLLKALTRMATSLSSWMREESGVDAIATVLALAEHGEPAIKAEAQLLVKRITQPQ